MFLAAAYGVEDENGGTSMANVNRNGRKLETLCKLFLDSGCKTCFLKDVVSKMKCSPFLFLPKAWF